MSYFRGNEYNFDPRTGRSFFQEYNPNILNRQRPSTYPNVNKSTWFGIFATILFLIVLGLLLWILIINFTKKDELLKKEDTSNNVNVTLQTPVPEKINNCKDIDSNNICFTTFNNMNQTKDQVITVGNINYVLTSDGNFQIKYKDAILYSTETYGQGVVFMGLDNNGKLGLQDNKGNNITLLSNSDLSKTFIYINDRAQIYTKDSNSIINYILDFQNKYNFINNTNFLILPYKLELEKIYEIGNIQLKSNIDGSLTINGKNSKIQYYRYQYSDSNYTNWIFRNGQLVVQDKNGIDKGTIGVKDLSSGQVLLLSKDGKLGYISTKNVMITSIVDFSSKIDSKDL